MRERDAALDQAISTVAVLREVLLRLLFPNPDDPVR
jgi:hypothetical protein